MTRATRVTVSTFGVLAGLAGLEHGVGEVLQDNKAPGGLVTQSWPDAEAFAILGGEPALTVIPNLLVSGVLTILVSLAFLVWATLFLGRRRGGPVLILISALLLLVGGGFGPPLLGLILGVAATRLQTPLTWWRTRLPNGVRRFLAGAWPWLFGAALAAWLLLMPGTMLLDRYTLVSDPELVVSTAALSAFGLLFLSLGAAFARDSQGRASG